MINLTTYSLDYWGYGLVLARLFDAGKYIIQSEKIRRLKTSKGHSRDFTNMAFGVDIYLLLYFLFRNWDIYMIISCILMAICTGYYWFIVFLYYDYRTYPKKKIVKRPPILVYLWNSLLPDHIRRHL